MHHQHGDVIISTTGVNGIPKDAKPLKHKVLAEGEVTGHKHEITQGEAQLYEGTDGTLYMRVTGDNAVVEHPQHGVQEVEEGDYSIKRVQEYDPFDEVIRDARD